MWEQSNPDAYRGDCSVCGRYITVKKDGTVRHHRSDTCVNGRHLYRCEGTGKPPAPDPRPPLYTGEVS